MLKYKGMQKKVIKDIINLRITY